MQQTKLTLTPSEAAAELGVSKTKMYELLHNGQIPALRVGRRILIPTEELKNWLLEQAHINREISPRGDS